MKTPPMKAFYAFLFFSALTISMSAQTFQLTRKITDSQQQPLPDAYIELQHPWSEVYKTAVADASGKYELSDVQQGDYKIRVSFLGYKDYLQELTFYSGM